MTGKRRKGGRAKGDGWTRDVTINKGNGKYGEGRLMCKEREEGLDGKEKENREDLRK